MILLLESVQKTGELFFHGSGAFANHQSDLRRAQPGGETQSQEFTLPGIESGQQRLELYQAFLVQKLSIHILVAAGAMERDRQGIPGKDGFATPMPINDGMASNLKKPGHERASAWLVAGESLQCLEKDLSVRSAASSSFSRRART